MRLLTMRVLLFAAQSIATAWTELYDCCCSAALVDPITTGMPIERATLRIRVSMDVPSVRSWLGSVRNETVLSGTNTSQRRRPLRDADHENR